ncbi:MAG: helix-turn-helix transcriptional regulator [Filimonas sp.]|nr:helix-turn-helix transcriptional regulator [Filimonas sp.]
MSLEVEYYLTSTQQWLRDYAVALSIAVEELVEVRGNGLVFPPSLATGRYELYELTDGLALWMVDCTYHQQIVHVRNPVLGNDHFCLTFNISEDVLTLFKQSGRVVKSGKDLSSAIFFSSQSQGLRYVIKSGTHVKSGGLVFHYNWAYKIFAQNDIPLRKSRLMAIVNNAPIQFTANMDLKIFSVVEELFACRLPHYIKLKYFEGMAIQLFAMFLRNAVTEDTEEERLLSGDAARVVEFKERLDTIIEDGGEIPSMEDAMEICNMTKMNFSKLFQFFYKENYSDYIKKARIRTAVRLIKEGYSVTEAGHKIGYLNLGHFARVFFEEVGMTPKKYQQSLQAKS